MGYQIYDQTSSTQRIGASNSGGLSLGPAAPDTGLQVALRKLFDGFGLTTGSVPSAGITRIEGSVVLSSLTISTITLSRKPVGFGVMPGAFILGFNSNLMTAAYPETTAGLTQSFNYSVF